MCECSGGWTGVTCDTGRFLRTLWVTQCFSLTFYHRRSGPVSFRGLRVSCPNIFPIACPKIKWSCPNITGFIFSPKVIIWKRSRGLQPPAPPPPLLVHSKNTKVSHDPEKGPLGPTSIPGQRWPGNQSNWQILGSDWPSSGSYFASSWLIPGSSLTRNGVWPQWTLFRVTLTRVFLECTHMTLNQCPFRFWERIDCRLSILVHPYKMDGVS